MAIASPALAQPYMGRPHPEAGHALSDLRAARDLLRQGGARGVSPTDNQVINLLEQIMRSTQRVFEADGQRMRHEETLGVDATANVQSRHENVRIFLEAAARDLDAPEDNPIARPYLQQARYQLGEAIQLVRQRRR